MDSKFALGMGGELLVLGAVVSSYGLFGYLGIPATFIILEVIPFLVLAVGVDNIFILVQTVDRIGELPSETTAEHIGRVVGQVSPSILLSATSEAACFFIGALSEMPAIRAFSLYAGVALVINFILQLTCFVALLSLDIRRQKSNRFDVLCCVKAKAKLEKGSGSRGILYRTMKNIYAPKLMKLPVRIFVMVAFSAWFCTSVAMWPKLDVGLDQDSIMPKDSYVARYLRATFKYLTVGPPVYFVVKDTGFDYTDEYNQRKIKPGQNEMSLAGQIFSASRAKEQSKIAKSTSNWLDDYLSWAKHYGCCKRNVTTGGYCPNHITDYR